MKAERVFCQLRDKLATSAAALQPVWDRCDEDHDGKINQRELERFLRKIGFTISQKELRRLVAFPELRDFRLHGGVDFVTMKDALLQSDFHEGDRIILQGTSTKHQGMTTLTFLEAEEANRKFQHLLKMNFRKVRKAFMQVDSCLLYTSPSPRDRG